MAIHSFDSFCHDRRYIPITETVILLSNDQKSNRMKFYTPLMRARTHSLKGIMARLG